MGETHEDAEGTVRSWNDEEGWGVLDSPQTPGGCFAIFGAVEVAGFRKLTPGERVTFQYITFEADGYSYQATKVQPTTSGGGPAPATIVDPTA